MPEQDKSLVDPFDFLTDVFQRPPLFGEYTVDRLWQDKHIVDEAGIIRLKEGVEMIMPGDNAELNVELITPIAMEEKLRFAIREGGRTVGAGVVAKIIE